MEPHSQTAKPASPGRERRSKLILVHATLRGCCVLASFATVVIAIYGSARYHAGRMFIGSFVAVWIVPLPTLCVCVFGR